MSALGWKQAFNHDLPYASPSVRSWDAISARHSNPGLLSSSKEDSDLNSILLDPSQHQKVKVTVPLIQNFTVGGNE